MDSINNINILTDNVFSCYGNLPSNDPSYAAYSCGSSAVHVPSSFFGSFVGFIVFLFAAMMLAFKYKQSHEVTNSYIDRLSQWKVTLQTWLDESNLLIQSINDEKTSELALYTHMLMSLRYISTIATIMIVLLGCVIYPASKYFYHTVTYQYGWSISSAFMSGIGAACLVLTLYFLVCFVVVRQFLQQNNKYISKSTNMFGESERFRRDFSQAIRTNTFVTTKTNIWSYLPSKKQLCELLVYAIALSANVVIVTSVNVAYALVYIQSNNIREIELVKLLISLFQIIWSFLFVPFALSLLSNDAQFRPVRASVYLTLIYFFNNLLVPCITSAVLLSNCLKNIFIGFQNVSTTYSWTIYSTESIGLSAYLTSNTVSETVSFQPPFIYSAECNAGILVAYIPIYMLIYSLQTFFFPIFYVILCSMPLQRIPPFLLNILPNIAWPLNNSHPSGFPFRMGNAIASIMVDFAVLLTFGCLFPPLAIFIGVCIASKTFTKELLIGRFMFICKQNQSTLQPIKIRKGVSHRIAFAISDEYMKQTVSFAPSQQPLNHSVDISNYNDVSITTNTTSSGNKTYLEFWPIDCLDRSCKGMWRSPLKCIWLILFSMIPFYAFMGLDITGGNGFEFIHDCIILVIVVLIPLFLYFTRNLSMKEIVNFLFQTSQMESMSQEMNASRIEKGISLREFNQIQKNPLNSSFFMQDTTAVSSTLQIEQTISKNDSGEACSSA